jgi:metallo-beta-lactamase family protein
MVDEKKIPRFPVYVDSPLATNLTDVYRRHRENYDEESWMDFPREDDKPLAFRNLRYVSSRDESIQLNTKKGPFMVISASGMMSAGRIVHHLRNSLTDKKNVVFVTGYQAEGTIGRRILEGARYVEIFGEPVKVEAQVELINELSAHADRDQLQAYLEQIKGLERVALVHGEPHQADDFKQQLTQAHPEWRVIRPKEGDVLEID